MSGADVGGGGGQKRHAKKGRKPKKRMKIRIDMTPLVDVAFLLLTFFMLTTVFRLPNAFEIVLPDTITVQVKVPETKMITIRVGNDMTVFWSIGIFTAHRMPYEALTDSLKAKKAQWESRYTPQQLKSFEAFPNDPNTKHPDWIFKIVLDRKAKSKALIEIVDKLKILDMTRFTIVPINEIDKKEMAKAIKDRR